jgi:predicted dehydrogenase
MASTAKTDGRTTVRYAVVGLGHIAQAAVLPAFGHSTKKHRTRNSELAAFVSDDPVKHKRLGKKYGVKLHYSYDEYDRCLTSGEIDAVYIALPNSMHHEYTVRAARAGIHILCEKPLAVTSAQCEEMIRACAEHGVKLMTAYRLHFERANLQAIKTVQAGVIGEPQIFSSVFAFQVREGNIRVQRELGGGTLYDIGIYCINAARYFFRDEPVEVFASSVKGTDPRFEDVDAMTTAVLRFPQDRLASFTVSFSSADVAAYQVVGTKGDLRADNAYEYSEDIQLQFTVKDKRHTRSFGKRDQFGPELIYFSECVLKDREPEPSGEEGWADVRVIEALYESAETGRPVKLGRFERKNRPTPGQEITLAAVEEPDLIHAEPPTDE